MLAISAGYSDHQVSLLPVEINSLGVLYDRDAAVHDMLVRSRGTMWYGDAQADIGRDDFLSFLHLLHVYLFHVATFHQQFSCLANGFLSCPGRRPEEDHRGSQYLLRWGCQPPFQFIQCRIIQELFDDDDLCLGVLSRYP